MAKYSELFILFLEFPKSKDGKEIIVQKKIFDWIQFESEKEFGIPVEVFMDSTDRKMTVTSNNITFFQYTIGREENQSFHPARILNEYDAARLMAINSICKWEKDEAIIQEIEELPDDVLCQRVRGYRKKYFERMALKILGQAEIDRPLHEDLRNMGLTDVASFFPRNLEYVEELYFNVFGEKA